MAIKKKYGVIKIVLLGILFFAVPIDATRRGRKKEQRKKHGGPRHATDTSHMNNEPAQVSDMLKAVNMVFETGIDEEPEQNSNALVQQLIAPWAVTFYGLEAIIVDPTITDEERTKQFKALFRTVKSRDHQEEILTYSVPLIDKTLLMTAVEHKREGIVRVLLDIAADNTLCMEQAIKRGMLAERGSAEKVRLLDLAISGGHVNMVRLLWNSGQCSEQEMADREGKHPLVMAWEAMVAAEYNQQPDQKETAQKKAAQVVRFFAKKQMSKELMERCLPDLSASGTLVRALFDSYCELGDTISAATKAYDGADDSDEDHPESQGQGFNVPIDRDGNTFLMNVVKNLKQDTLSVVQDIVGEKGANPCIKNAEGKNAFDVAMEVVTRTAEEKAQKKAIIQALLKGVRSKEARETLFVEAAMSSNMILLEELEPTVNARVKSKALKYAIEYVQVGPFKLLLKKDEMRAGGMVDHDNVPFIETAVCTAIKYSQLSKNPNIAGDAAAGLKCKMTEVFVSTLLNCGADVGPVARYSQDANLSDDLRAHLATAVGVARAKSQIAAVHADEEAKARQEKQAKLDAVTKQSVNAKAFEQLDTYIMGTVTGDEAKEKALKAVRWLAKDGQIHIRIGSESKTYLMFALEYGRVDIAHALMDQGVDRAVVDAQGRNAVDYLNAASPYILLPDGVDLWVRLNGLPECTQEEQQAAYADLLKKTILEQKTSEKERIILVGAYLKYFTHINRPLDDSGITLLMLAANHGYCGIVGLLLAKGADPMSTDVVGDNVFVVVHKNRGLDVDIKRTITKGLFKSLMEAKQQVAERESAIIALLADAAERGDRLLLEVIEKEGGITPLVFAAGHGHYNIVKALLKKGANPMKKDAAGKSAFTVVFQNRRLLSDELCTEMTRELWETFLQRQSKTKIARERALFDVVQDAIVHDNFVLLSEVLGSEVNLYVKNNDGADLLSFAINKGKVAIAKDLWESGHFKCDIMAREKRHPLAAALLASNRNASTELVTYFKQQDDITIGANICNSTTDKWVLAELKKIRRKRAVAGAASAAEDAGAVPVAAESDDAEWKELTAELLASFPDDLLPVEPEAPKQSSVMTSESDSKSDSTLSGQEKQERKSREERARKEKIKRDQRRARKEQEKKDEEERQRLAAEERRRKELERSLRPMVMQIAAQAVDEAQRRDEENSKKERALRVEAIGTATRDTQIEQLRRHLRLEAGEEDEAITRPSRAFALARSVLLRADRDLLAASDRLLQAARDGDSEYIRKLHDYCAEKASLLGNNKDIPALNTMYEFVNAQDKYGNSPLLIAIIQGNFKFADTLLTHFGKPQQEELMRENKAHQSIVNTLFDLEKVDARIDHADVYLQGKPYYLQVLNTLLRNPAHKKSALANSVLEKLFPRNRYSSIDDARVAGLSSNKKKSLWAAMSVRDYGELLLSDDMQKDTAYVLRSECEASKPEAQLAASSVAREPFQGFAAPLFAADLSDDEDEELKDDSDHKAVITSNFAPLSARPKPLTVDPERAYFIKRLFDAIKTSRFADAHLLLDHHGSLSRQELMRQNEHGESIVSALFDLEKADAHIDLAGEQENSPYYMQVLKALIKKPESKFKTFIEPVLKKLFPHSVYASVDAMRASDLRDNNQSIFAAMSVKDYGQLLFDNVAQEQVREIIALQAGMSQGVAGKADEKKE